MGHLHNKKFSQIFNGLVVALVFNIFLLGNLAFAETKVLVRLFDTNPKPVIRRVFLSGQYRFLPPSGLNNNLSVSKQLALELSHGKIQIRSQSGLLLAKSDSLRIQATGNKGICIQRTPPNSTLCYAGELWISVDSKAGLKFQNIVSMAHYMESVLASETPPGWPLEALKAQAVITQTRLNSKPKRKFLNKSANRSGQTYIEVSDSTTDESYKGIIHNSIASHAVSKVMGERLTYQHQPIEAYYHSTCAGHTTDDGYFSGEIKSKHPYSIGVRCSYCADSPFYKVYTAHVPVSAWQRFFKKGWPLLLSADKSNRYRLVSSLEQVTSAYQLWLLIGQRLGWDKAPGTNFWLEKGRGRNANDILIYSRGAGHGVGLCQWGARKMALLSRDYKAILRFYYPKAEVEKQKF